LEGDPPKADTQELLGDFKLVGIILDSEPQAILENRKKKETVFLSVGESIGKSVVEEIHKGSVIFLDGEKRIELVP